MALATLLKALLRGTTDEKQIESSRNGALYIQKDLPDYTDLVRRNLVWRVSETTAVAAFIGSTFPTTASQLVLYNNESEGSGKSYVIMAVGASQIAAGAALASWHIIFGVSQIKQTTLPTGDLAASVIRPMRGNGGAYSGKALVDLAPTLNVDPIYQALPFSNSVNNPVNSLAGPGVSFNQHGVIILPPSSLLALAVVAADVGVTTRLAIIWGEIYLDLP
jgi:hypothetical protein